MARERKNNLFKQVPAPHVRRNMFDLSHEVKMSGKFGYLYPVLCMDTLPGDTISDTMNVMVRFAPLLAPVMHRCDVTTHFFFVPNRLLWDNWQDFITGGQDGLQVPIPPFVTPFDLAAHGAVAGTFSVGSLWDYLGLPPIIGSAPSVWSSQKVSALPFRALGKIWNDFYRDPNLDQEMELNTELDGEVSEETELAGLMTIGKFRRGFEKDYFTSALPWAQRGAQVLMPLSGIAEADDITYKSGSVDQVFEGGAPMSQARSLESDANANLVGVGGSPSPVFAELRNIDEITFENAATTINDFRRALAIQRWLEANARGGARYVEQIEGHFNVRVPDYRIQRAEYLGGGKQPVSISEVLATAETGSEVDVGDMKGHGLSVGRTNRFSYRCVEHGFVIGLLSVTMRTAYSQGIPRMFTREDKFDFGWPELANLGEQEIKSREVFYSMDADDDDDNELLFGYIPRYAEYKFHNDRIAGQFRTTLGFWHLVRNFTSRPSLDSAFTTIHEHDADEETFRRIFAVQDGTDYLWMQLYHHLSARRPLPYFGVPSI